MSLLDELKNIQKVDKIDIGMLVAEWDDIKEEYPTLKNIDGLLETLVNLEMCEMSDECIIEKNLTNLQNKVAEHGLKVLDVVLDDYIEE